MTGSNAYMSKEAGLNEVTEFMQALRRVLANVHTSMICEVVACTNSGSVAGVGTVTLKILMNQVDSNGNTVAPGAMLYGVPYGRVSSGTNGIIMDPVAGDIGMASFCEKDISIIMANYGAGNPGSNRRNSISDAVFVCYVGKTIPTQYVRFLPAGGGIDVVSPTALTATIGSGSTQGNLTMNSSGVSMTFGSSGYGFNITAAGTAFVGPVTGNSTAIFTGEGTFNGGHTVSAHKHEVTGIQTGGSTVNSQAPTG